MTSERADELDHDRILKRVASEVLSPIGLVQRGRSRTWIDDHGWWVIQVDFGSSAFGRGTFLMVGSAFLWCAFPAIPFELDIKDRWPTPTSPAGTEYIEARGPDTWEPDVRAFAEGAAAHVASIRERPHGVSALWAQLQAEPDRFWTRYHLGVAAGLTGEVGASKAALGSVVDEAEETGIEWMAEQRGTALALLEAVDDPARFRELVASIVVARRRQVKLRVVDPTDIVRALSAT